jgi:hypothetical protein
VTLSGARLSSTVLLVVTLLSACAGPDTSASPQPTSSRTGAAAAPSTGPTASIPIASGLTATAPPLRAVDWGNAVIPASVCGAAQPIHLSNGQAVVDSTRWPDFPRVHVTLGPVQYGNLGGDAHQEAAVDIWCDNGGGTADGQLADTWVIFADDASSPRVIGALIPQQPPNPNTPHVPYFDGDLQMLPGRIITHELWYSPADGTCCPSGRATTVWTYSDDSLHATATTIDTQPTP